MTLRSKPIFQWILICSGTAALLLVVLLWEMNQSRRTGGMYNRRQALGSVKQLGLALFDFDTEFGQFPDAATIPDVKARSSTNLLLGSESSNQLFRQLLATTAKTEGIFWDRTTGNLQPPDERLGRDALAPGECSFTYIAGLSSASDPAAPVVMTPAIRSTWKFDRKPYDGQAVVLFLDSSARHLPIDKNGDVILNGMNLFDPRQLYWHGKAPDIKWPE